eukprot:scaffold42714_cov67-Attheya_sp.AAC.3
MLLVPGIIVALHFESELGECFEVMSHWPAPMPGGELYIRAGFQVVPFWGQACRNPVAHFLVTHWAQQMGFMCQNPWDEIQNLSNVVEYVLGLEPSNCRIIESTTHGGLQDSLLDFVTLLLTDMLQSFCMNEDYHMKEEHCKIVQVKAMRYHKSAGATKECPGAEKHDDHKSMKQMLGEQLLTNGKKYMQQSIDLLSTEFLNTLSIHDIKRTGFKEKGK